MEECRRASRMMPALFVGACAAIVLPVHAADGPTKTLEISMLMHQGYASEHCGVFPANAVLEYSLRTPYEVDFNLHHHGDTETVYPVKAVVAVRYDGQLTLSHAGQYCFQWRNLVDQSADFSIQLQYAVTPG